MKLFVLCVLMGWVAEGAFDMSEVVPCVRDAECVESSGAAGSCVSGVCKCKNGYRKANNTEVCVWVGDDFNQVMNTFMTTILFPDAQCNATSDMVLEMYDSIWQGTLAVSNVTYRICDSEGLMVATEVKVNLYAASVIFSMFDTDLADLLVQNSTIIVDMMKTSKTILSANRSDIFGTTYYTSLLNSLEHQCTDRTGVATSFPFKERCHALTCNNGYNLILNRSVTEAWPRFYSCSKAAGPLTDSEIVGIVFAVIAAFAFVALVVYFGIIKDAVQPSNEAKDEEQPKEEVSTGEPEEKKAPEATEPHADDEQVKEVTPNEPINDHPEA